MTTDSETGPIVRSWLESTTDSPYTTRLTVGRVMARLPGARRSWRGWRLPGRILPIHQESGVTVLLSGLEQSRRPGTRRYRGEGTSAAPGSMSCRQ